MSTDPAARVRDIVATMAPQPPGQLSDTHRLIEDLGYDSLRLMELTLVLERTFGLPRYRPEDLIGVLRVDQVIELVARTVAA
ncbi:acyl carrier protein [Nocardia sp. NPDC058658]|uniref:acyl carrier protein n=1 Tax=Nocardia sp. NPDC058658 TaxID=3346580 RepID=UPI003651DF39